MIRPIPDGSFIEVETDKVVIRKPGQTAHLADLGYTNYIEGIFVLKVYSDGSIAIEARQQIILADALQKLLGNDWEVKHL